jgi:hypothetical protein
MLADILARFVFERLALAGIRVPLFFLLVALVRWSIGSMPSSPICPYLRARSRGSFSVQFLQLPRPISRLRSDRVYFGTQLRAGLQHLQVQAGTVGVMARLGEPAHGQRCQLSLQPRLPIRTHCATPTKRLHSGMFRLTSANLCVRQVIDLAQISASGQREFAKHRLRRALVQAALP